MPRTKTSSHAYAKYVYFNPYLKCSRAFRVVVVRLQGGLDPAAGSAAGQRTRSIHCAPRPGGSGLERFRQASFYLEPAMKEEWTGDNRDKSHPRVSMRNIARPCACHKEGCRVWGSLWAEGMRPEAKGSKCDQSVIDDCSASFSALNRMWSERCQLILRHSIIHESTNSEAL